MSKTRRKTAPRDAEQVDLDYALVQLELVVAVQVDACEKHREAAEALAVDQLEMMVGELGDGWITEVRVLRARHRLLKAVPK